ncbi:MAG: hypothetical protein K6U02_07700 [Firmicutes bacterium]|nr:hypothetical protein [Bacillota bacterium]
MDQLLGRGVGREFQFPAHLEPLHHGLQIDVGEIPAERFSHGGADQFGGNGFRPFQLALVFQFQLAGDGRDSGVDVRHARDHLWLTVANGALFGVAEHAFECGDGQPLADARAPVHPLVAPGQEGNFFDGLADELRDEHGPAVALDPGLLGGNGHGFLQCGRVMGTDFRTDPVFQRRDDFSACGVILRVRREHQQDIQRQAHRIAFDLHVAFLHDVEQAHLNFARQVREFVDGKDAAVGPRQQAVVDRQFIGEIATAAGGFDRVHVANHVGDGHVGCGQFLDVPGSAVQPGDRGGVTQRRDPFPAGAADRTVWVVVDLASGHHRNGLVEKIHQAAQEAAFGLPAQAEQDEVVSRQNGIDDLRHDGVFIAMDAGEKGFARLDLRQQVFAHLLLDAAVCQTGFGPLAAAEFTQSSGTLAHRSRTFCAPRRGGRCGSTHYMTLSPRSQPPGV